MAKLLGSRKRRTADLSTRTRGSHKERWCHCDQWNRITELPNDRQPQRMELVRPFSGSLESATYAYYLSGRDYGTTRGYPNESEFTVVKVGLPLPVVLSTIELKSAARSIFTTILRPISLSFKIPTSNHSKTLSSEWQHVILPTDDFSAVQQSSIRYITLLNTCVCGRYNYDNDGTEGGTPNVQPAFASGQDSFLASLATKGIHILERSYTTYQQFVHTEVGPSQSQMI